VKISIVKRIHDKILRLGAVLGACVICKVLEKLETGLCSGRLPQNKNLERKEKRVWSGKKRENRKRHPGAVSGACTMAESLKNLQDSFPLPALSRPPQNTTL
jgi:hypothetical protein